MKSQQSIDLLVIEDDEVDAENVIRTVKKNQLPFQVHTESNGMTGLEYLRASVLDEDVPKLVVLLDINMPGMNGHEFLQEIRKDEKLHRLIVFVLTTSAHERDKSLAYDQNVAGYFTKANVKDVLTAISKYSECVQFPPLTASAENSLSL